MDKYCYITGILDPSAARSEVFKVVNKEYIGPSGRSFSKGSSKYTVLWDGNVARVSGFSSTVQATVDAFAYFLLKGGLTTTLSHPGNCERYIRTSADMTNLFKAMQRGRIYMSRSIDSNLPYEDRKKIEETSRRLSPSDAAFCKAVSVQIGRFVDPTRQLQAVDVPLHVVKLRKREGIAQASLPKVVSAFVDFFTDLQELLSDEVLKARTDTVTAYATETMAFIVKMLPLTSKEQWLHDLLGYLLVRRRPVNFSYDSRVSWVYDVVATVKDALKLFFNKDMSGGIKELKPYIPIESFDPFHELSSYFSRLSYQLSAGKGAKICPELAEKLVRRLMEDNYRLRLTPVVSLIIILIYYSIYGTNTTRIVRRPCRLKVRLRGKVEEVSLQGVEDRAYKLSQKRGVNAQRIVCRYYSDLTCLARRHYDIHRNNWKTLNYVDGRLAYDTADCITSRVRNMIDSADHARIIQYIKTNDNPVTGTAMPHQQ
uniref:Hsp90-like protein n=1 Tax=Grapevine leafroll-associated virus 3 TaxID=55951 RepID=A0A2S0M2W4_9CLOS|nr:Hsp90-like protein [Grapevine leafroll-associated virus 3]AXI81991.1 Hsp90-like protein [Grapevine leafroll-associated virus 3]AXI82003.1 Hsp90-like protein [Grapevine leafroll-associated virus 3]AXI82028.1 Hsp90-like protein [Grapevine leafroll-associated virus 3]